MTENDLWKQTVRFHGHECPGLAIGFKAAMLAGELLSGSGDRGDEDIVCLAETDACGIDAFQVILKTTVGSGSMRIKYKGKNAFSVYDRVSGASFRLVWKNDIKALSRADKIRLILESGGRELFDIKETAEPFPDRASVYPSAVCSVCGEVTAENALKYSAGKAYCPDCGGGI